MIFYGFLTMLGLSAFRALANWRVGITLIVFVAAIQDPVRKLVPGTPGFLALAIVPIFFALILASVASTRDWWSGFRRAMPTIANLLIALMVLSIPAAAISMTYGPGSWQLTLIGAFSYSIIFLAMISGFHYPRGRYTLRRLLSFYCIVHGIMLSGALLEYFRWFPDWAALGDEAMGFNWRRWVPGYVVEIICGFYRSGDVMGWHAVAVSCLSIILLMTGKGPKRWAWSVVLGIAVIALLLCGRRKMVYMLPVFITALGWMYWQAGRKINKLSLMGLLAVPVLSILIIGDWLGDESAQVRYYTQTADQTLTSLEGHGFKSLATTYQQFGFFGAGLGTATPGSQHINATRPGTWQESGPSRILVELGVLGALGFLAVIVAIIAAMWRVTLRKLKAATPDSQYSAGLMAFFIANAGSLTVSGQILADPFIAVFLGLLVGIVLSSARAQIPAVSAAPAAVGRVPDRSVTFRRPAPVSQLN